MKTKKVLAAVMAGAVSLGLLAGCSGNDGTTANNAETTYQIGVVQFAPHPSLDNCYEGFVQGLKQEGFEEGKNLKIDFQNAQGEFATASQISSKFASDKKDLILGIATPAAQAAYNAAQGKVPVVYSAVNDPVGAQLAGADGTNIAGVTGTQDVLPVDAQLKMIRTLMPDAKKIGILYTTSEANSVYTIETYKTLAVNYGFEIVPKGIAEASDLALAIDALLPTVDCVSNMTDNTVVNNLPILLEKANAAKKPVFGSEVEQVANGCAATFGVDYVKLGIENGVMAAKILKGEKAENIPLKEFEESSFSYNSKVLAELGIHADAAYLAEGEDVAK